MGAGARAPGDVGAVDLVGLELDLDLGPEPPSSRDTPARWSREGSEETSGQGGLRRAVFATGRGLPNQLAADDLVEAARLGDREQVG